jgi:predicted negative regulator of RcsB-dependent stress response
MYNLGLMYRDGIGTEKDIERAEKLFSGTVHKGYSKGMFVLGEILIARGEKEKAIKLFNSGAAKGEQRCIDALTAMGLPIPEYTGWVKKKKSS